MGEFRMPSLGADMDSGTILEWRVQPGDVVHRGDIVAVVDTEKSDIEVEVFEDGVVEELLVGVGHEVAVGTPLARLAPLGAAVTPKPLATATAKAPRASKPAKKAPAKKVATTKAPAKRAPATRVATAAPAPPDGRVRSSPYARRRAEELGLDLRTVTGSGHGGVIVAADLAATAPAGVAAAATAAAPPAAGPASPPAAERRTGAERQQAMRQAIADLMARSKREIPHYYLATTVDLSACMTWLAAENERRPISERLLPAALLLKATALAAKEVPALNGFWVDGGFQRASAVHLGVAVSLRGGGLLAPAVHDADRLTLDELMHALRDLVERARSGRLRSSEMSDPTLTVTNLGDQGADEVHGVIYPPQVALVGFGRIVERPWASGGLLGVRPTVRATLAADHRASDGHEGSRLLAVLERLLHTPEEL